MKTKQQVERLAESLGTELTINSPAPHLDCGIEAPEGYRWSCGPSELIGSQWPGESAGLIWDDLYNRMREGLEAE